MTGKFTPYKPKCDILESVVRKMTSDHPQFLDQDERKLIMKLAERELARINTLNRRKTIEEDRIRTDK